MVSPSTLANEGSILTITPLSGGGNLQLVPWSARGVTQTLEQFAGNNQFIRETINGETINLTPTWMRKYNSTITCMDIRTPCLDNAFRGETCLVDCIYELSFPTGGTANRSVVSGSERTENGFTFYRPALIMMVLDIKMSNVEWPADYHWQIDLREVSAP